MNEKNPSLLKDEKQKALAADRKKILGLSPEKALEVIAEHPFPVTLIQSMAEEDLYFLVHHIGPDESMPILALASNDQWDYFIDIEGWDKDQINPHQMTRWLKRLLKADADRFTYWIIGEKKDETAFYLYRNIELHIREYEQDPSEISGDFFTEDQTYYIRPRAYPKEHEKLQEERDLFIKDLLNRLAVYDYALYRDFLLKTQSLIPAETEEELFRQRNVRLAEKGLLPFDEAIGVYQHLKPEELLNRERKSETFEGRNVDTYPFAIDPEQPAKDADLFSQTLSRINDPAMLQKLQAEFAALCNQVITADQIRIREKEALSPIVRKVSGYLSIGLEKTASKQQNDAPYAHANVIQKYLLSDIFRVGYGCALNLKWKTEKWQRTSWYHHQGLPLNFWGEVFMGVLGGLLIKKPLCFDNYKTGSLYREFSGLLDIETTEARLNTIIAFDDLLSIMDIEIGPPQSHGLLTYENLLLTLWANHYLNTDGSAKAPQALTLEQFKRLDKELWRHGPRPRKISDTMREIFLGWLSDRSGLTPLDISERMATALEQLFKNIEAELGNVTQKDLDPRFISLFLIKIA